MKRLIVGSTIILCLTWPVVCIAQSATPFGEQFQVNTYTTGRQEKPTVAVGPDGEFVITWTKLYGSQVRPRAVVAQRYDSNGNPQSGEFQVSTYTTDLQQGPSSVDVDGAGNFIVVWSSFRLVGNGNSTGDIQGRRFDSTGAAIGDEFQINTYTTGIQSVSSVAADTIGNFIVAWSSTDSSGTDISDRSIQVRRFDSFGLPLGGEFQVNTYTTSSQRLGAAAVDGAGNFIVVWESDGSSGSDTSNLSIQGQRFGSNGAAIGEEFQINTYTTGSQLSPAVATDATGNFLVVWEDSAKRDIQGQFFDNSGAAVGSEFQVNTTTWEQFHPQVDVDGNGNFVAVWSGGSDSDNSEGRNILARIFSSTGAPVGNDFQVNTYTTSRQGALGVALDGDGDFVVTWQSFGSPGNDNDETSIQAQLFNGPLVSELVLAVNGVFNDEDMDGFGDPGETIDYTYEVTNVSEPNRPLTDVNISDIEVSPILCPSGNPIPILAIGMSETCTGSYILTQVDVDAGRVDTTTTADSNEIDPIDANETVLLSRNPAVDLVATGMLDLGGNGVVTVGDPINYLVDVTNTGNVTLTNVAITNTLGVTITCPGGNPIPSLEPGDSTTCTSSYAITQTDINVGVVDNTFDLTADEPGAGQVIAQDSHSEIIPRAAFACDGEAYMVRNLDAELSQIDRADSPFTFVPIGGLTGIEINNLGFRATDGLLYGVELNASGNDQLIQIDATGAVFGLGRPAGLPADIRFEGGDISTDGSTMYLDANNDAQLYQVALPSLTLTSVTKSGATGDVFDWAHSPTDGMLYGGDSSDGQLAMLDPSTGVRLDFDVTGLPSGEAYGGAWFNSVGQLFLYRNSGEIYEIEIDLEGSGPPGLVVDVQTGPGSNNNDAAACPQNTIGAAKQMSATSDGLPETVTIDYVFENLDGTEDLFNLSSIDDLSAVFGTHGVDWTFTSISSTPASFANPSFDGHTVTELINQAPTQSLFGGATATVTVTLQLLTVDQGMTFSLDRLDFEVVTESLSSPFAITHAGDSRIFVVEQAGRIAIIDDGSLLPTRFLDISSRVGTLGRLPGMYSLAFHPDYMNNGFFYVSYKDNAGDSIISRFSVTGDPDVADPASEAILLSVTAPLNPNTNGGDLHFGPDGYLYVAFGDGSNVNQTCASQIGSIFFGKILRLDVDQNIGTPPYYGIPASNPFVGDVDIRDEIWALGLHDPWRFSFDRLTGDMLIGDSGQIREEVDFQTTASTGGENYGWVAMDGTLCFDGNLLCPFLDLPVCNAPEYTLPILEYANSGDRCAVIGGYVYRGSTIPDADGLYFYGDFCTGEIFAASDPGGGWQSEVLPNRFPSVITFGEDVNGELYLARNDVLYRLTGPAGVEFCNQVEILGENSGGRVFGDLSTEGGDPDPNSDGSPDERQPTCIDISRLAAIQLAKDGTLDDGGDGFADAGDTIDYTFTVTNTGNVTLTDVTLTDPMVPTIDCGGVTSTPQISSLAPASVVVCAGSYTLTQADIDAGQKDNTADVLGLDLEGNPITDQDMHTENLPQRDAEITLDKTGTFNDENGDGFADIGESISYNLTVTNSGGLTLTDVTLTDPMLSTIDCGGVTTTPQITNLAPAVMVTCTGTYTLTQADIDVGQKDNTADASGQDPGGNPITDQDMHTENLPQRDAEITLDKTGTFNDENGDGFADIGESISYTLTVTNSGGLTLTDVIVTDPMLSTIDCGGVTTTPQIASLAPTASVICTGVYSMTQADIDAGLKDNTADASGQDPGGNPVNDQDTHSENLPQPPAEITLAKTGTFNDESGDGFADFGETISYTLTVTNSGDLTLADVTLTDPMLSTIDCGGVTTTPQIASLAPAAMVICAGSYTITQADIDAGQRDNTADVSGQDPGGNLVNDQDSHSENLPQPPAGLTLAKTGTFNDENGNAIANVGETISYTLTATNSGGLTLTDVTVTDPMLPTIDCGGITTTPQITSLAPAAVVVCTGTYAITQADIDAGQKDNTADASGQDPQGNPVSDQDSHSQVLPNGERVPFACDGEPVLVKDQNAEFNHIDRSNSPFVFVPIGSPAGIEINNIGFRSTDGFLYALELTSNGNAGVIQIDATGRVFELGQPPGLPSRRFDGGDISPDGSTMYITSNSQALYRLDLTELPTLPPVTSVAKTGANGLVFDWAVSPIDGMLYGGDSTSGQLAILNPMTGVRTDMNLPGLPPSTGYGGAWFNATGTLFLYENSGAIYEINLSGPTVVSTQTGPGATRNDGAACIDLRPPAGISLNKTGTIDLGSNDIADVGEMIEYTFEITNIGAATLTDVTLSDPIIASFICPSGHPIPLLAGSASQTCTATYAITQADVDARLRNNTATVTGTYSGGPISAQDSHSQPLPNGEPIPFVCEDDAFLIQGQNAQLTRVDRSVSPFVLVPIGAKTGREINNLGFRSTDSLLYALELSTSGNVQIIQIDATGAVFGLGRPPGLPAGIRFDAGDVSPDGSTMYITATNRDLYVLDLTSVPTLPTVTRVDITGDSGLVFDWAVSPIDGRLYGGDATSGQLASIDPATGIRTDVNLAGLPSGTDYYGGAWFDAAGRLFLYQNSGTIYEIDLSGPTVVDTQTGDGSTRNDGAACIDPTLPPLLSGEIQVNTYTTGEQGAASVAMDTDGNFVVVWHSDGSQGTDAADKSIQGQRYASDGLPLGGQFQVNSYTTDRQRHPSVAMSPGGDFVVVWESPSSGQFILGQRYSSDGATVGGEFQVNTSFSQNGYPATAMDAEGGFVVVWGAFFNGFTIQGQRYASNGTALGGQFQISTYATGARRRPAVAMDAEGDFVVAWESDGSSGTDTSFYSVQARRYASDGSSLGGQFQVNSYTSNGQRQVSVAMDTEGDFVVVWQSRGSVGTDTFASYSIQGQRYASDGSSLGGQFQINSYTTTNQRLPEVAKDSDGDFVVVWDSRQSGTDSEYSIQGQRFASDGSTIGGQFQLNTYTTDWQLRTDVAIDAEGDFIAVWQSRGSHETDSSDYSVQMSGGNSSQ